MFGFFDFVIIWIVLLVRGCMFVNNLFEGIFVIINVMLKDSDRYICIVKNDVNEVKVFVYIFVFFKLKFFIYFVVKLNFYIGGNILFLC